MTSSAKWKLDLAISPKEDCPRGGRSQITGPSCTHHREKYADLTNIPRTSKQMLLEKHRGTRDGDHWLLWKVLGLLFHEQLFCLCLIQGYFFGEHEHINLITHFRRRFGRAVERRVHLIPDSPLLSGLVIQF